jgi:hypothetical protein
MMIEVGSVLLHEDVVKENFVCNLTKCKGACCLEGDSGAPLNHDELAVLAEIYPKVKPFMTAKGIATIEREGTHVTDFEGDYTTPCVDTNKECAYVTWENGITKCAIEKAYEHGRNQLAKAHLMPPVPHTYYRLPRIRSVELRPLEHLQPGLQLWRPTESKSTRVFERPAYTQIRRRMVPRTGRYRCRNLKY